MENQKALLSFRTKCNITGFIVTLLGIYFVYFFLYEDLIQTPFKVLYSLELTKNYHSVLALILSLVEWRLISNLPFIALSSRKDGKDHKPVIAYLTAAGLIVYTGSVIAHNLALTYVYSMP